MARIVAADGETWWVGQVDVSAEAHAERTWTLGANILRGRVVSGPEHTPVAGVEVHAIGPADASAAPGVSGLRFATAKTGPDGRFEFRHARAGTYSFCADQGDSGARRPGVALPGDAEIVLEMAPHGRIAVRFADEDHESLLKAKLRLLTADGEDAGDFGEAEGGDDLVTGGLVPARYEIEVSLGERTRRFSVEVRPGETSRVEISAP
jgi:hypothetical protein